MFIRDSWCNNFTKKATVCTLDVELLCLSLRPFYLPRDYGNIFICAVYILPSGNASRAAYCIADCVHEQLRNKPEAPIFVVGDVNQCRLEQALPGFQQYVKNNTRRNNILDKCYGNIKDAYAARIRPPLSNSDHNTIQLIPIFKPVIKRSKLVFKTISVWKEEHKEKLSGCLFSTNWDIFYEDNDAHFAAEAITGYIHFCVDNIILKKTIKKYPDSKDYITPDIKKCIQRKKEAFRNKDPVGLRKAHRELKGKLKVAREQHSTRVREVYSSKSPKEIWDSIK